MKVQVTWGEPTFAMVDKISVPTESRDAELLPGLDHGLIDCRTFLEWAVQFICEATGHTDVRNFGLDAVDPGIAKTQGPDVAQTFADRLLENIQ